MKVFYPTTITQMNCHEMEILQTQHPGSCAVWMWLKGRAYLGHGVLEPIPECVMPVILRRLGLSEEDFQKILQNLKALGWISKDGQFADWDKLELEERQAMRSLRRQKRRSRVWLEAENRRRSQQFN